MPDTRQITLCVTMGRRPALLTQTLRSLGPIVAEAAVLAVNDFGDEETNAVFRSLVPHGRIVPQPGKLGHHAAVDRMYAQVRTPFVLHLEDDWQFDRTDFIPEAMAILSAAPEVSAVCLRALEDFGPEADYARKAARHSVNGAAYARLDALHDQWHGFTFNPHIAPLALWRDLAPFAGFKKERHISRKVRAQGRHVAYLQPGACAHIGHDQSLANPPKPSFWARLLGRNPQR